eukprot:scaffold80865_cov55-Attheya_sp.AAC.3
MSGGKRNRQGDNRNGSSSSSSYLPYMLERTDIWCSQSELNMTFRVIWVDGCDKNATPMDIVYESHTANGEKNQEVNGNDKKQLPTSPEMDSCVKVFLEQLISTQLMSQGSSSGLLKHVACAVLQERLRSQLSHTLNSVAFVADGSILPRKSGNSSLPMESPPAVPSCAPKDSDMTATVQIDMGLLHSHVIDNLPNSNANNSKDGSIVSMTGLLVPAGVTLICGGGYHGKSTLLRTIAAGVYNKIPGDGREYCVTVSNAISVRAEDGRYVNKCNVSGFIANLPDLTNPKSGKVVVDTTQFSTHEASGSTSQAANVSEAIEMGATALLVDEDVSAANFMARDGRMRALVADESITPLLYRVNGMYQHHGISSVVVVGGVGDWLDVQDHVILMDKYVSADATDKARSISRQFSYGHVQYAGRGVVHRLPWDKEGTPNQRRPIHASDPIFSNTQVSLLDGGDRIALLNKEDDENSDEDDGHVSMADDDTGVIDMSRCEQLLGKREQLYGCGLCLVWLLQHSQKHQSKSITELLDNMEHSMGSEKDDSGSEQESSLTGMARLLVDLETSNNESDFRVHLLESLGHAYRPRRYEVAMALTRMRGIKFIDIPKDDDAAEVDEAARERERQKRELAELWSSRRKGRVAHG